MVKCSTPATVAVTFSQNQFLGAHVLYDKELLEKNNYQVDCIVANSGIANAATGTSSGFQPNHKNHI
jgi:N-acetylglutamate synthase/N-acetylornithine aminotransferase